MRQPAAFAPCTSQHGHHLGRHLRPSTAISTAADQGRQFCSSLKAAAQGRQFLLPSGRTQTSLPAFPSAEKKSRPSGPCFHRTCPLCFASCPLPFGQSASSPPFSSPSAPPNHPGCCIHPVPSACHKHHEPRHGRQARPPEQPSAPESCRTEPTSEGSRAAMSEAGQCVADPL